MIYDSTTSTKLQLIFCNGSNTNTALNPVKATNWAWDKTNFTIICKSNIQRDIIVESLRSLIRLLMPSEEPEIYTQSLNSSDKMNNTDDNNFTMIGNKENRLMIDIPNTSGNSVEINGLTYNYNDAEIEQFIFVKLLESNLQRVMSINQSLKMELDISYLATDEVKRLYINEKEKVETLNEKLEVLSASFDIADASKNDLVLEVAQLKGKINNLSLKDNFSDDDTAVSLSTKSVGSEFNNGVYNDEEDKSILINEKKEDTISEIQSPSIVATDEMGDSFNKKNNQEFINKKKKNSSKVNDNNGNYGIDMLYKDERLAQLMKDASIAKEKLKLHKLKEKDLDLTIKKLKNSWEEEKFQASATESRHQRLVGELTSTHKKILRDNDVLKEQLKQLRLESHAKEKNFTKQLSVIQNQLSEANILLIKEQRDNKKLLGQANMKTEDIVTKLDAVSEENKAIQYNNNKLITERNALRRQLSSLKKDLLSLAHYDALVSEKESLLLELNLHKAQSLEHADNIEVFKKACKDLNNKKLLPHDLKFLLDFC